MLSRVLRGDVKDKGNASLSMKLEDDSPFSKLKRFGEPGWPNLFLELKNGAD